jgi:hypothetical protein
VVKPKIERFPAAVAERVEGVSEFLPPVGDPLVGGDYVIAGDRKGWLVADVSLVARLPASVGIEAAKDAAAQRGEQVAARGRSRISVGGTVAQREKDILDGVFDQRGAGRQAFAVAPKRWIMGSEQRLNVRARCCARFCRGSAVYLCGVIAPALCVCRLRVRGA